MISVTVAAVVNLAIVVFISHIEIRSVAERFIDSVVEHEC